PAPATAPEPVAAPAPEPEPAQAPATAPAPDQGGNKGGRVEEEQPAHVEDETPETTDASVTRVADAVHVQPGRPEQQGRPEQPERAARPEKAIPTTLAQAYLIVDSGLDALLNSEHTGDYSSEQLRDLTESLMDLSTLLTTQALSEVSNGTLSEEQKNFLIRYNEIIERICIDFPTLRKKLQEKEIYFYTADTRGDDTLSGVITQTGEETLNIHKGIWFIGDFEGTVNIGSGVLLYGGKIQELKCYGGDAVVGLASKISTSSSAPSIVLCNLSYSDNVISLFRNNPLKNFGASKIFIFNAMETSSKGLIIRKFLQRGNKGVNQGILFPNMDQGSAEQAKRENKAIHKNAINERFSLVPETVVGADEAEAAPVTKNEIVADTDTDTDTAVEDVAPEQEEDQATAVDTPATETKRINTLEVIGRTDTTVGDATIIDGRINASAENRQSEIDEHLKAIFPERSAEEISLTGIEQRTKALIEQGVIASASVIGVSIQDAQYGQETNFSIRLSTQIITLKLLDKLEEIQENRGQPISQEDISKVLLDSSKSLIARTRGNYPHRNPYVVLVQRPDGRIVIVSTGTIVYAKRDLDGNIDLLEQRLKGREDLPEIIDDSNYRKLTGFTDFADDRWQEKEGWQENISSTELSLETGETIVILGNKYKLKNDSLTLQDSADFLKLKLMQRLKEREKPTEVGKVNRSLIEYYSRLLSILTSKNRNDIINTQSLTKNLETGSILLVHSKKKNVTVQSQTSIAVSTKPEETTPAEAQG
ncbi:MAG TPA: hypothetical protein PLX79_02230, partial [Candidatus Dojkabacteria bacterium]|nr:hypothetical protein [Candidatus Dojkabacteria bacterium]